MGRRFFVLALFLASVLLVSAQGRKIKIACVGNSITYGSGIMHRDTLSYPAQLQFWLGNDYEVKNFGVGGATLLKKGDKPYWEQPAFEAVKNYLPDIIIIKLGTNDSKPQNWQFASAFKQDYQQMIKTFSQLSSRPRIILATPAPVFTDHKWGINQQIVHKEIVPIVQELAKENRLDLVNMHEILAEAGNHFPDAVHPDPLAAAMMVEEIYVTLFHKTAANRGKSFNSAVHPVPSPEYRGAAAGWGSGNTWFSQHDAINSLGQERAVSLVFLGNSITQAWGGAGREVKSPVASLWDSLYAPRNGVNFGISGDRTQHILWRIKNGNFDGIAPRVVVLTIGVNNFNTNTADEISQGIRAIISAIHKKSPKTNIILVGPLPAGGTEEHPKRIMYEQVHDRIGDFANLEYVDYLKISHPFIREDGTINEALLAPDHIHLTASGYRAWANLLEPSLQKYFEN